ncbi:MAG: glycoside hydrolase [Ruminococcus sp.]|nr:glycoside hydrolase [Ruminococcus sp.]
MKKCKAILAAVMVMATALTAPFSTVSAADTKMNINIDLGGDKKAISPYIYGVNQYGIDVDKITSTAYRQGGNRMSAYNWENNASNAGSDWVHSSDNNLSKSDEPADCVQELSRVAAKNNVPYKMTTLQMAGYVSADKDGTVTEEEAAPSARWNEVLFTKNAPFDETPDLTDGKVYMDEYVNYIINTLGDSTSPTGIQGYSLDNEPALWHHTHSRVHPNPVSVQELADKSIELSKSVKKLDPKAEIFGPALFGYSAYVNLADDENSDEWETLKAENNYRWYIDCYLDQMKKASDEAGVRLLDVLDIHYYTEMTGDCRVNQCTNSSHVACAEARMQSVRSLYEEGFVENSWIGQWFSQDLPILPIVQASIDKYYPGTKLAITEYDFGGDNVSGAIAQAEALGCFADAEVYLATKWGCNNYQASAINLYTNYDGKGSAFGDMLLPTKTDDVALSSAYASIKGDDQSTVTAMITNKDMKNAENAVINLKNADTEYKAAAVYAISGDSADIHLLKIVTDITDNVLNVELPAYSASMVVITDDASDFDGLELYDPDRITTKTETFDAPEDMINANGYIEIPISDPAHLKQIKLTADVTSSAGSSWGTAGCAVCINAETLDGKGFWTSKSYSLPLGKDSTAVVEFDGTMTKTVDEVSETVEAVVADGKVELQQWWAASEKMEAEADDVITAKYTKIEVVYEYDSQEDPTDTPVKPAAAYGDVNCDGEVTIVDVLKLMQNLLSGTELTEQGILNADVDCDGSPTATDAMNILKNTISLITLPVVNE